MASSTPSSQVLTKREPDQALMPPPPPPKRVKRPATVLDEDVYTSALSQIIARDFFPGLVETQLKQEYLDALDSKNKDWIAAARKKLTDVVASPTGARGVGNNNNNKKVSATPEQTPREWTGDTPASAYSTTASTTTADTATTAPDVSKLGLLAFQAQYTSEDNESFNKLIDKQNAKRREKYAWLWSGNKIPSARQLAHRRREIQRITAQGGDPAKERQQQLIKTDLDVRPATPDAWTVRPENSLMFLPSSVENTYETVRQRAERLSRAEPKHIIYHNTRMQDPAAGIEQQRQPPPSSSISAIEDAITGRPRRSSTEVGSTAGDETPRVNGYYSFVDKDEPDKEEEDEKEERTNTDLSILG